MKNVVIGSFALSLVLAALFLAVQAVLQLNAPCESVSPQECTFQAESAREIAKLQGMGAVGCFMVGAGTFLFLSSKTKQKAPTS